MVVLQVALRAPCCGCVTGGIESSMPCGCHVTGHALRAPCHVVVLQAALRATHDVVNTVLQVAHICNSLCFSYMWLKEINYI